MSVILRTGRDLPPNAAKEIWLAVTGSAPDLPRANRLPDLARRLEQAFMDIREDWWALCRRRAGDPGAGFSHTVTAGSFGSDFGLMLAWTRLVDDLAAAASAILVICDDPWLFRHLADRPGVKAGTPPALLPAEIQTALRGWLARIRLAVRLAISARILAPQRAVFSSGATAILVYGHPESDAAGYDAYFGDLMRRIPDLKRVLHTDASALAARRLGIDGRTTSLHAWGTAAFALLRLPWTRWRPRAIGPDKAYHWLLRRSASRENSGGGPAMNRWQKYCQERWLVEARPARILWPWENHGWERALCRSARPLGVTTVGYQHTVVGPHQINYAPAANVDGIAAIPDHVACDGPAYRDELVAWGVPEDRLSIAGAFRFRRDGGPRFEPDAPVFVPLSAIPQAAAAQVMAAHRLAEAGFDVVMKEHPMYPFTAMDSANRHDGIGPRRTIVALRDQEALSAVLYSTGTSGLEALLAGIPTVRLLLEDRITIDVLPSGVSVPAATVDTVVDMFKAGLARPDVAWESILSPVNEMTWRCLASAEPESRPARAQIDGVS